MEKLNNIHPGEVLKAEFLDPMGLTAYKLAKAIFIPQNRLSEIIHGKRSISVDTALRFSKFFGTSPKFWLGLQMDYDLEEKKLETSAEIQEIKAFQE
jgi:addiction module HigA family antidote